MADKQKVSVVGLLKEVDFHMVKSAAEKLHQKEPDVFVQPDIVGLLECDWINFINLKKREKKGEMWSFQDCVVVFIDGQLIGGKDDFLKLANDTYNCQDFRPLPLWYAMAKETYKNHFVDTKHNFVFLEIAIGNESIGKMILELISDRLPKTCENFMALIQGHMVEDKRHDPPLKLSYRNTIIHRIVPNGWIQGGDFEGGRGVGGESIYGPIFEDEDFSVAHTKRGIVGMANKGRHTNGSQFYITLQPAPWMDTKYVAFGQVIEGLNVLDILENQETFNERPKKSCSIIDCGILDVNQLWK
ncbi:probable inactive peptidyl-prolyl cis-trans isomerase-like 6 [Exaiptasia diaphana]|uniref:Peptidyl-prolyl cis-trans isomerase n=1 Tax=Exaiptasia diaphana TaxID=2652724 RepID=A0A913XGI7_EXADI|nr:probable inactive peptidyl-prolyl cis-trans isomerase-like 6 [Exaiptasia diaphana]KXJ26099.1 Peptidyl-prolyl cis-trans isomerase-like 6 [Exaiptasia diaphana]